MAMFQSFTKTSAMMIGEVEANDILEQRAWIANLLLILFEIITVILLMNLMVIFFYESFYESYIIKKQNFFEL